MTMAGRRYRSEQAMEGQCYIARREEQGGAGWRGMAVGGGGAQCAAGAIGGGVI